MPKDPRRRSRPTPRPSPPDPERAAYLRLHGIAQHHVRVQWTVHYLVIEPHRALGVFRLPGGVYCLVGFAGEKFWRYTFPGNARDLLADKYIELQQVVASTKT